MKKWIIIIIILAALLFVSVAFNFYQLGVKNGMVQAGIIAPSNFF
ncbi:MAG: hypothetical protein WCJ54_02340 [Actinomycetota bacterium]